MSPSPFLLPYQGVSPQLAEPLAAGSATSAILGRVTLGARAIIGQYAVIRADGNTVTIGNDFNLGPDATVHIAHDAYATVVGDRVVVGRNAIVHACTVGDDCVIGDNAVILDGSVVETGCVLEDGAVVFPRSHLEGGRIYAGIPARPVREITVGMVRARATALAAANAQAAERPFPTAISLDLEAAPDAFIAGTARLAGRIRLAEGSSIWFGCDIDAGHAEIIIGERTNIQDNSLIRLDQKPFSIGRHSVIGHNVSLGGCTIGENTLIGMGARLGEGCRVDDDVMVAAGAVVEPGQHLESGWLWTGSPARAHSRLDTRKREMIPATVSGYFAYGQAFRALQQG